MGSPSRGGDVVHVAYVFHINQLSLPSPFYSVLVSVSVLMALPRVFRIDRTWQVMLMCMHALYKFAGLRNRAQPPKICQGEG